MLALACWQCAIVASRGGPRTFLDTVSEATLRPRIPNFPDDFDTNLSKRAVLATPGNSESFQSARQLPQWKRHKTHSLVT